MKTHCYHNEIHDRMHYQSVSRFNPLPIPTEPCARSHPKPAGYPLAANNRSGMKRTAALFPGFINIGSYEEAVPNAITLLGADTGPNPARLWSNIANSKTKSAGYSRLTTSRYQRYRTEPCRFVPQLMEHPFELSLYAVLAANPTDLRA